VKTLLEGHAEHAIASSHKGAPLAREWAHQVISLLESAVAQVHPAQGALREAALLLRLQIEVPAGVPDGTGCLLAWQAHKVRDYIDSHITQPVLVSDLCALLDRSEAHFSRSFRSTFGYSPHAWVVRRRVELAAKHMLQTENSLSQIALECGFADQAHLSKHFRAVTGRTPAAWRRANQSAPLSVNSAIRAPTASPAHRRSKLRELVTAPQV
jgi:AraC family transcriptional regulator